MLILAVTALVTVGTFAWALAQPTMYTASSRILLTSLSAKTLKALGASSDGGSGGLETLSTKTQAQLIGSSAVASRVSEAIRGRLSTEDLARAVDARVVSDHLIEIQAVDASPVLAQAEANAFADAYLAYRAASAAEDVAEVTRQISEQRAGIEARAAEAEHAIEQASASLALLPPVEQSDVAQVSARESLTADQAQATAERTRLMASIRDLNVQQADLAGATGSPGQVVTRAELPVRPAGPNVLVLGLAGLLGGLMLGMVAALVRDRLGERVGSDEDAWAAGAPPPDRLPAVEGSSGPSGPLTPDRVPAGEPGQVGLSGETAEFYRKLRETLAARGLGERHRILLVTSPGRREGKSATAANLAVALAQAGLSTIAVSADLRRPRLAALLGVKDQPGLTDVLKGRTTLAAALRSSKIPNLRVLPTAPERATGSDLLATPAFGRLLRSISDECDVVVVDAAGVADGADASILAGVCGASLLVVQDGVTLAGAASRAVQTLSRAGAPPLGTVVSPPPPISAPVRVAVASLGAATVLLGSVVWASTATVRGTPDSGLALGSAAPAQQGAALAPNTGLPDIPDLDDPAVQADLEAKVAPLVAAAPEKTSAATAGQTLKTPGKNGKPAGGQSGKAAQAAGGPGAPAAAPGNPAAAPAPAVVPPAPGPVSAPLPPTVSPTPDPSPSRSRRPRSPTPSPTATRTRTPTPAPTDSPTRRPPRPSPPPTVQPSPTPTRTRTPQPPRPTVSPTRPAPPQPSPTRPSRPPRPSPAPSPTDNDPTPPWWWPFPRPRPSPTSTRQPTPRPSPTPAPSDSGPGPSHVSPTPTASGPAQPPGGQGGSGGGAGPSSPGPSSPSPADPSPGTGSGGNGSGPGAGAGGSSPGPGSGSGPGSGGGYGGSGNPGSGGGSGSDGSPSPGSPSPSP